MVDFLLPKRSKDLTGNSFGSLTAIKPLRLSKQGTVIWQWFCKCGNTYEAAGTSIKSVASAAVNPEVPSCGCVLVSRAKETSTIHGYSKHPLFAIWQAMKQRCYNKNHKEFHKYGASGVYVCDQWLHDPNSFIEWALSNGYRKGAHLDKDVLSDELRVQRHYSPETCMFIDAADNVSYSASRDNFNHNKRIKLTPLDVIQIKKMYQKGEASQKAIADLYKVSKATIQRIVTKD